MIAPKLPALEDLATELETLEIYPNSIVLIAIEDCRVTWGWFSAAERKALRAALERARKRRAAQNVKKGGVHDAMRYPDLKQKTPCARPGGRRRHIESSRNYHLSRKHLILCGGSNWLPQNHELSIICHE